MTKSKFSFDDLNEKSVEFQILTRNGFLHGIGKFLVRQTSDGLLDVVLEVCELVTSTEEVSHQFQVPQEIVGKIERHSDQSVAEFRLFS